MARQKGQNSVSRQLQASVKTQVNESGYRFGPYARRELDQLIAQGTGILERESLVRDTRSVNRAQENLDKLLAAMVEQADTQESTILTRSLLREIIISICPLWPFC